MTRVADLRVWAVLLAAAVSAAIVVTMMGVALDAGTAVAATATDATIEAATPFSVQDGQTGEAFAKCSRKKRALGGGVVQSGPATESLRTVASGPLDATGFTSETITGDKARQWYAAVSNYSFIGDLREFKVFAVCE